MFNVVTTLAPSSLIGSSSFLLVMRTMHKSLDKVPFQGGGSDVVSVSCFGVRFSVMFHFMFVHYTFSSVWVA